MAEANWTLGQTSAHYESGGRGPATISTGAGDLGGKSYGTYQLASNTGTLREFLNDSGYSEQFSGLPLAGSTFDNKWKELARTDDNFGNAQHDFIKASHYDKQVERLGNLGTELESRGPAVQDMLWSTANQYRGLTKSLVEGGLKNQDVSTLTDSDIVTKVQDYKRSHVEQNFRSSPDLWNSLKNRARNEKETLLELSRSYGGNTLQNEKNLKQSSPQDISSPQSSLSPPHQNNQEVMAIYQTLHNGLADKITQAGAGRFVEPMIAATTQACVENGIKADKIGSMDITSKNTIIVSSEWGEKNVSVDAFEAAKINPQETLQAASNLQESANQQQQEQNLQIQQQNKSMAM